MVKTWEVAEAVTGEQVGWFTRGSKPYRKCYVKIGLRLIATFPGDDLGKSKAISLAEFINLTVKLAVEEKLGQQAERVIEFLRNDGFETLAKEMKRKEVFKDAELSGSEN